MICLVFIFFFFQAEDGIRDWSVTGVQTCALPIWASPTRRRSPEHRTKENGRRACAPPVLRPYLRHCLGRQPPHPEPPFARRTPVVRPAWHVKIGRAHV